MKLYLAARYSRRAEMEGHAERLKRLGYEVTSRWLGGHKEIWTEEYNQQLTEFSVIDLEDIDAADAVMSFTELRATPVTGGGRHVEFGYGFARGKRMIVIGEKENIFHHLPGVEIYPGLNVWLAHERNGGG